MFSNNTIDFVSRLSMLLKRKVSKYCSLFTNSKSVSIARSIQNEVEIGNRRVEQIALQNSCFRVSVQQISLFSPLQWLRNEKARNHATLLGLEERYIDSIDKVMVHCKFSNPCLRASLREAGVKDMENYDSISRNKQFFSSTKGSPFSFYCTFDCGLNGMINGTADEGALILSSLQGASSH